MLFRGVAMLTGVLVVACGATSPTPAAPPASTDAPHPQTEESAKEPLRVLLEARKVVINRTNEQALNGMLELPKQPTPDAPTPLHVLFGDDATGQSLYALLEASTRAGWPVAELANQAPSISFRLARTSDVPATQELPTLLLWPRLLHAGEIALPEGQGPIDGLLNTTFPYGTNVRLASGCEAGTCKQIRLQISRDTLLSELRDALNQVSLVNGGPVEVLLISGSMPEPGRPHAGLGHTGLRGRLPPVVIQREVRAAYGDLRKCYEEGLRRDPELSGKVTVRFVIGRDGKVSNAEVMADQTNIPDGEVIACVVKRYSEIQFPEPDGGVVTVVYPIVFEPGE